MQTYFEILAVVAGKTKLGQWYLENPIFRLFAGAWGVRQSRRNLALIFMWLLVDCAALYSLWFLIPEPSLYFSIVFAFFPIFSFFACFWRLHGSMMHCRSINHFDMLLLTNMSDHDVLEGFFTARSHPAYFLCIPIFVLNVIQLSAYLHLNMPAQGLFIFIVLVFLQIIVRISGEVGGIMGTQAAFQTSNMLATVGYAFAGLGALGMMLVLVIAGIMAPWNYVERRINELSRRFRKVLSGELDVARMESPFEVRLSEQSEA